MRALLLAWVALAPAAGRGVVTGIAARVNGAEISNQRLEGFFEAFLAERGRNLTARRVEAARAEALAGAGFEALARQRSDDASAREGGALPPFSRGTMVRPFEEAAFALRPGEISEVVETGHGFHVIRLEERIPEVRLPEAEVRERLRERLLLEKRQAAVTRRLDALRAAATIERAGEGRR
jgi:parvulin-like peptidyl-prolyl isomerase